MELNKHCPTSPGIRHKIYIGSDFLVKKRPERSLVDTKHRAFGRNNQGKITCRHKGGGHKRLYRKIDFKRNCFNVVGKVSTIEYDPNRNCDIALINYENGEKRYILHVDGLAIGDSIESGFNIQAKLGNTLPLKKIPIGVNVHNIEQIPGNGAKFARSAGSFAKIMSKDKKNVALRLMSGEIRIFNENCLATIGKIGNASFSLQKLGKAGRSRWLGIRPTVRGSAMNAVDHPHGGGEGKSPIGMPGPSNPWGRKIMGHKTRKINKLSNRYIISPRTKGL